MNYALLVLLLMCLFSFLVARRTGVLSTLSAFSIFNSTCFLYFFLTQNVGYVPKVLYSALPLYGLVDYTVETASVYMLLNVVTYLTSLTLGKVTRSGIDSYADSILAVARSKFSVMFLVFCVFLTTAHAIDFDFEYIWSYRGYHTIRDLEDIGLTNPISVHYQKLGPLYAACCGSLAMVAWWSGRRLQSAAFISLASYGFLLAFATASRESALVLGVTVATYYLIRRRFDVWFYFGLAMTLLAIAYAIAARSRYGDIGLQHVFGNLEKIYSTNILDFLISVLSNVAQGATIFAHAVRLQPQYSFDYIFLSQFSPFPGNLDNFANVAAIAQVKASQVNPLSAVAEAYYFGYFYFFIFLVVIMGVLRSSARIVKSGSPVALPIYGVVILLIFRLHQYPMRISNRLILVYLTLWAVHVTIKWWTGRKRVAIARNLIARDL